MCASAPASYCPRHLCALLCFVTVAGIEWFGDKQIYSARIDAVPKQLHPGVLLFINNCHSCHPDGGSLIAPALQLRSSEKLKNFSLFTYWVRHPNPSMSAFRPFRLSDQQIQVLYQYLIDFVWESQTPNVDRRRKMYRSRAAVTVRKAANEGINTPHPGYGYVRRPLLLYPAGPYLHRARSLPVKSLPGCAVEQSPQEAMKMSRRFHSQRIFTLFFPSIVCRLDTPTNYI